MTANERFDIKVRLDTSGCLLWTASCNEDGYGLFWDGTNRPSGSRRIVKSHRFAWIRAHGVPAEGLNVCHTCDNPPCVNTAHMFLGTQLENIADRHIKGRTAHHHGDQSGTKKLTEAEVFFARKSAMAGKTQKEIALLLGVSRTTIGAVARGETWAHLLTIAESNTVPKEDKQ